MSAPCFTCLLLIFCTSTILLQAEETENNDAKLETEAWALYKQAIGNEHGLDKLVGAEALFRKLVVLRQRDLGAEHFHTLQARGHVATMILLQGKFVEAEKEYRAVLAIRERTLGVEHWQVFSSCNDLAGCLELHKKLKEALEFAERAEKGFKKVFGPDDVMSKEAENTRKRIERELANEKGDQKGK